jgi:UPF0755 protein
MVAAARPEPTHDLYFVADGNGGHAFARSLEVHERNVAQYHRALAAADPPPPPPEKPPVRRSEAGRHRLPPHRHIIGVVKQTGAPAP